MEFHGDAFSMSWSWPRLRRVVVPLVLMAALAALLWRGTVTCAPVARALEATDVPPRYVQLVHDAADRHRVPPHRLAALISVESAWDPRARSPVGAMGLAQLMPDTAAYLSVQDPWNPRQNVMGGARYLREQFDRFGSWDLAAAAYNAGPEAVRRHGGIPPYPETLAYVPKVRARAHELAEAGAAAMVCD